MFALFPATCNLYRFSLPTERVSVNKARKDILLLEIQERFEPKRTPRKKKVEKESGKKRGKNNHTYFGKINF